MATESYVIKRIATGEVVLETFNAQLVRNLKPEYVAIPIREYLASLNRKIRAEAAS